MGGARVISLLTVCAMSSGWTAVPKIILNNGREMPAIALGTYLGFDQNGIVRSENKRLRDVAARAIDAGYRHFDTAAVYGTEPELGEAVRMKIAEGAVTRDDIFITTKLWNTHHTGDRVARALGDALDRMGLDYVDLFLMHWPMGLNEDYSFSDVDYMETWRALERAQARGLARSIGLSNFSQRQLQRVLRAGAVRPAALQIEIHPRMVQSELVEFARAEGVAVLGYSPLGSLARPGGARPRPDDPALAALARKYGKTAPQVVLRWLVDRNIVPIPKTVNSTRLKQNIDIFDFQLSKEEIEEINKFDAGTRYTLPSFWQDHPHYPFEKVPNPIPDPFIATINRNN